MNCSKFFLSLCLILSCAFTYASNDAIRSFWHPNYLGKRLAYCDMDICGKPVADKYCQLLGYDCARKSVIAHNVGFTRFLSTRMQCIGWGCNGFLVIDCERDLAHKPPKPYHFRERRFVYPRFNDYRVDWCYAKGRGCGARAAHSFCKRMGYLYAKSFIKQPCITATKTMGSQELCFGPQCNAFETILCYR